MTRKKGDEWLFTPPGETAPVYKAVLTDIGSHHVDLAAYASDGMERSSDREPWRQVWSPVETAVLTMKWDGCAHLGYRDPGLGHNWAHICGTGGFIREHQMLAWLWMLSLKLVGELGFEDEVGTLQFDATYRQENGD